MQEIEAELINSKFAGTDMFGECPLYFSALQNLQMILRFLFSQSQFDHLRNDSLTLALSQKTTRKSTRSYSFIAHSLATQGFPVIVGFIYWFSLHSCQNGQVLCVMQYDKNTFQTHTPPIWFAIEAYVIIYVSVTRFES